MTDMDTVIVQIKNRKAYKLLENMEDLGVIKLLEPASGDAQDSAARLQEIREITKDICVDLNNFKFDRNAANNYD
jgi:hypothetical protein